MPTESEMRSRRDSWPPTQVRLEPPTRRKQPPSSMEPRPLLEDIDEDPLTYFLTPAPNAHMEGDEDDDYNPLDFDAGIEDPSHPHEIVRSVSPSTLEGLRKPDHVLDRPSSPECDSDVTSPDDEDDDDDDEEYIRFSPLNSRLTSFRDLNHDNDIGPRSRSPVFGRSANALLSPSSFPAPHYRGLRPSYRLGRARSMPVRSRPAHLWREPSADVWSIEEETEEEMTREIVVVGGSDDGGARKDLVTESEAAKPKKRVRFLLPVAE